MSIRVRRFEPGDTPAIDRLNSRLASRGITDCVYPESSSTPSESRGDAMSQELYVAADGNEIRGGVWLHEHEFFRHGDPMRAGWLKYPVAESLINRDYGGVPGAMIVTLMRRQPEIMALGMGSRATPFAQLLASLGWRIEDVPFYAAPVRPARLLMHLPHLRRAGVAGATARLVARLGLATAAGAPLGALRYARTRLILRGVTTDTVTDFGAWADAVWQNSGRTYGFIARRDAAMLNLFYPHDFPRLDRVRVRLQGRDIGWVCTTLAEPDSKSAFREFGELRVGMVADALGQSTHAPAIIAAGIRHLVDAGADLIVTNQLHPSWRAPLRWLGFLPRPTNFLFASSKRMAARLGEQLDARDVFINRGDCDGPPRWW